MTTRQQRRDRRAQPLWAARASRAQHDPAEAAVFQWELARKRIRAIHDRGEQDRRWLALADLISRFNTTEAGDAA